MKRAILRSFGERLFDWANIILLTLLCLIIVLPFLNILALSFNDGQDATRGGISFWPRVFTLQNYIYIFKNKAVIEAYKVTILRTLIGTTSSVLLTGMAAFALKYKQLPGRNILMKIIFFTSIFNCGMIPYYILLKNLHLTKSFWLFIIPSLYNVFNIIVMRTYFETLGTSMEESAEIDGCNEFTIFFRIIAPVSMPVIAVIALFNCVYHWNDWFVGAFYLNTDKYIPLQTMLQKMITDNEALMRLLRENARLAAAANAQASITSQSMQMAMIVICTVPILCVYPFLQKYFVYGLMVGSIKE